MTDVWLVLLRYAAFLLMIMGASVLVASVLCGELRSDVQTPSQSHNCSSSIPCGSWPPVNFSSKKLFSWQAIRLAGVKP